MTLSFLAVSKGEEYVDTEDVSATINCPPAQSAS
jgi:hypothetical protein